jgi:hypothetical protein
LEKQAPYQASDSLFGISEGKAMLWTLFVILLALWLVGVVSSFTLGGFIHILLVLAVLSLIVQLMAGQSPAAR